MPVPGGYRVATPPPQKTIRPVEKKEPPAPAGPRKISEIPQELLNREGPVKIEDIHRAINQQNKPAAKINPVPVIPDDIIDDDDGGDGKKAKAGAKRGIGGIPGATPRHNQRNARQEQRKTKAEVELKGGRAGTLLNDDEGPRIRLKPKKQRVKGPTQPRVGKVPIDMPITVRSLSAAIGKRSGELLFKLMEHGAPPTITINSLIEPDMAETMALEAGCELDIKHPSDAEVPLYRGGQEARPAGRPPTASADRDDHGPRRSRQNLAARQDSQEQRRGHGSRRHHAGDPRLARGARRSAGYIPRYAGS